MSLHQTLQQAEDLDIRLEIVNDLPSRRYPARAKPRLRAWRVLHLTLGGSRRLVSPVPIRLACGCEVEV
jgi:hypothetical protein